MKDPIRFLDDTSDADALERAVLGASFDAGPDKSIEDQILAKIIATTALVPMAAVATHGLKSAGALKTSIALGVVKGFAVGMAIYGTVSGARAIAEHFSQPPAAPAVQVAAQLAPRASSNVAVKEIIPEHASTSNGIDASLDASAARAPSARSATPEPTLEASPRATPAVAAFAEERPAAAPHTNNLEAEARALRDARAALRAGQLAIARALLDESAARFAAPALDQEREALMIELLFRDGEVSKARQRAHIFLERFPESPHAARVKQLATSP